MGNRIPGWGLLLAISLPLLVLLSWKGLGWEASRINIERYGTWSGEHVMPELLWPMQRFYEKFRRPAGPGDVPLPAPPTQSGVKAWSVGPDTVLRVELDARHEGRPIVLHYVPIVRGGASVHYDCVSDAFPVRAARFCRADAVRSEADIPAQLVANETALRAMPALVNAQGTTIAPGGAGSVLVVPEPAAELAVCGPRCVKPQSCVTPRPLACLRLVREGSVTRTVITTTDESYAGSRFAALVEADAVCARAAGMDAEVLRVGSSGLAVGLAGGNEYWVHDEYRPANNCWSVPR